MKILNNKKTMMQIAFSAIFLGVVLIIFNPLASLQSVRESPVVLENNYNANLENALINDIYIGDAGAPVVIEEYIDLQCGMTKYWWNEVLPQIKEEYVETGKVKIIFRDYPLGFGEKEVKLAEASHCAFEQGKYEEYINKIYEMWENGEVEAVSVAQNTNLDMEQFNECFESGKYAQLVRANFDKGNSLGVKGTPTFFVNGEIIEGAQPFETFQGKIDEKLASS